MPAAKSENRGELDSPLAALGPLIARMFWLLGALMLWLSLSSCFDALIVYNYATVRQPGDLKTATIRIIEVSSRTPNFKVRFDDGEIAWLSFPDLLGADPKGGFKMPQISEDAKEQLKGCTATAKIRTVFSAYGRIRQVWDLSCPQARIHYGPEEAASEIRQHPRSDLAWELLFAAVFLCLAYLLAVVARKLAEM